MPSPHDQVKCRIVPAFVQCRVRALEPVLDSPNLQTEEWTDRTDNTTSARSTITVHEHLLLLVPIASELDCIFHFDCYAV